MAYASTEIGKFRGQVGSLVNALRDIDAALAIVEDQGATDAERQAFFQAEFGVDSNNTDITWAQFAQGVLAVRAMQTAYETNKLSLAKLLT